MIMTKYSNNVKTNEWLNSIARIKKINTAISNAYDFLEGKDYEVVAVCAFGSMNYLCDNENSDTDIYAIIIPEANFYIWGNVVGKTYSGTIGASDNKSEIKLVPIHIFVKKLINMDLQTIEILFTQWKLINPKYYVEFNNILSLREEFAKYDKPKYLYNILSAFGTTYNNVMKSCDLYEKYDIMYNKQIYQAYRLMQTGFYYSHDELFENSLVPWTPETLDEARTWKYQSTFQKNYVDKLAILKENYEFQIRKDYFSIKEDYEKNNILESFEKQELKNTAENFAKKIIFQKLKEEMEF